MKKFSKLIGIGIGVVAALVISASTAQAQNLLTDGSFENGTFTGNPIGLAGVGQGWANNFGGAVPVQSDMSSAAASPEDGSYSLLTVNAVGNNWNPVGTYQIVGGGVNGVNINVGATYSLSAYALQDANTPLSGTYGTPIDMQIQFLDSTLANISTIDLGWSALGPVGTWQQYSLSGVAPAGTVYASAYLMFMDNGQTSPDIVYFDNAILSVPEPTTLALLSLGLAVPLYVIRRRKS